MTKTILIAGLILLSAGIYTCQYPVNSSELPDPQKFLIIDAALTETFGKVTVTYTLTDVTPQGAYQFPVPPNAVAFVLDSHGNRTDFLPDGTVNTAFHGVVGETYKLYVVADGETYESKAETMVACPDIDTLDAFYTRESYRDPADLYYDGFDVYAQLKDDGAQENFYQWDWIHYERLASCDVTEENGRQVRLPCNPYDCWGITYNTRVSVQSDKLRNGTVLAHKVVRVPFVKPPNKYYLRVEQRSITPSVFAYLQSIETQTQNVGTPFDIPAQTKFNPNVFNVNNPTEKILGVFSVYSYRRKIIYVNLLQTIPGAQVKIVPENLPFTSNPFAAAPCNESLYRTRIKPEGWED